MSLCAGKVLRFEGARFKFIMGSSRSGGLGVSRWVVDNWSLMSSPAPIVALFAVYLLLVLRVDPRS